MMSIKAVVFDLGNVLVDVVHARAAAALHASCTEPQRFHDAISSSAVLHRFETGELDRRRFFAELSAEAGVSVSFDAFCDAFCDIFTPVPEMIQAHATLRRRAVPTYLFSNTSELHFEHLLRTCDFLADFDAHFLSYELRCMKPDARIYELLEKKTGLRGPEIFYIDDRLENVEAGACRDWQVIHHGSPDETIARLSELRLL
jgi:FMN phosphatase YigB (HAD superfamily)